MTAPAVHDCPFCRGAGCPHCGGGEVDDREIYQAPTAPGLYPDLPESIYHGDTTSLSSTGVRQLVKAGGPAKHHGAVHEESDVFDIGTAAHTMLLGTGTQFVEVAADSWSTKAAKDARAAARKEGKVALLTKQVAATREMVAAAWARPEVYSLMTSKPDGIGEMSAYAMDPASWVMLRARFDWILFGPDRRVTVVDYKGLALDTAIPTPSGWTTMGALSVGDEVFAADGAVCRVREKSGVHQRDCYRITFDDATSIVCDAEHRWPTRSGAAPGVPSVLTAQEIARTLRGRAGRQHRIRLAGALALPPVELPIDPYVLGAWLGDGTAAGGTITKPDEELFDLIAARGYAIAPRPARTDKCPTRTVYGLRKQLRLAGLLGHKHVPDVYMRASAAQRMELLRGLMDTDGSYNSTRHQVVFVSVDKAQSMAVRELALSLGERAILHHINGTGYGRAVTSWRVTWRPQRFNPFRLSRKAAGVTLAAVATSRQRIVQSCEKTLTVPTQCIVVDSVDHTYLCGEQMVPTHNTSKNASPQAFARSAADLGYHVQEAHYRRVLVELGYVVDRFVFLTQEKVPPYLTCLHEFDAEAVAVGDRIVTAGIEIFAKCHAADEWPGYNDRIHRMSLPAWAIGEW